MFGNFGRQGRGVWTFQASGLLGTTPSVIEMTVDCSGATCAGGDNMDPLEETEEDQAVEIDPTGRFARYNVVLGKGSSKIVYKAFDRLQGIEVAWNQVRLSDSLKHPLRSRLFSEIAVLSKLKHRNIMTFYKSWLDDQHRTVNFITEYFHSGTLRRHRLSHKCITLQVLKRWAWQILQGLVYLHGHDPPIIHRDLKCDNIFIHGVTGQVKIGDLGLAKLLTAGLSKAQSVLGTPEYMAPELYDERYNEKVDIYAYGMCLMELVCMEFPYMECDNRCQIFRKVTHGVYPAALSRIEETEVRDFIELCISHDHMQRPAARELLKHPFFDTVRNEQEITPSISHENCGELQAVAEAKGSCGDLSDLKTFSLRATDVQGKMVKFKLRMRSADGSINCWAFHFDIMSDTVDAVAKEMEEDFDLVPAEVAVFSSLLQEEMDKARPYAEIGTRTSASLRPIPAGGSSSEMTGSCERMSSELQEATSTSDQCLSDGLILVDLRELPESRVDCIGNKKTWTRALEHNSFSLGMGDCNVVDKDCLCSPWGLEDINMKPRVPEGTLNSDNQANNIRIHSLRRKQCASEPCLSIRESCHSEIGVPLGVVSKGQPLMGVLPVCPNDNTNNVAGQPILYQKLEEYTMFEGEKGKHSYRHTGEEVLENYKLTMVQALCKLQMNERIVSSMMPYGSNAPLGAESKTASPNTEPYHGDVALSNGRELTSWASSNKAGSLHRASQQVQAGNWENFGQSQSWSLSAKHEQQQGVWKEAAVHWSEREVRLLDLELSSGRQYAMDVQSSAMLQFAPGSSSNTHRKIEFKSQRLSQLGTRENVGCLKAYHGCFAPSDGSGDANACCMNSCSEKYASVFQWKSSSKRLHVRPSAGKRHGSVSNSEWDRTPDRICVMEVKQCVDGVSQDDTNSVERGISVPIRSGVDPAFIGVRTYHPQYSATDRHSSPSATISGGWRLWRNLAMRVLKQGKCKQHIYNVEPQIVGSGSLLRCSSGICVALQNRDSSPIIPRLQAM